MIKGQIDINVLLAFGFGLIFISAMLVFAVAVPDPSQFSQWIFITVLALAASGIAAVIPGMLSVNLPYVKAGGALAVFAIVFMMKPAIVTAVARVTPPSISPELVIQSYLSKIDHGKYDDAWSELDEASKQNVARDRDAYRQVYNAARTPLGPVSARTFLGVQELQTPPGLPQGVYRTIGYRTRFSASCHFETVVVRGSADQIWRVYEHQISIVPVPCS